MIKEEENRVDVLENYRYFSEIIWVNKKTFFMKSTLIKFFLFTSILIGGAIFSSCEKEKEEVDPTEPLTVEQINEYILNVISETGEFNWADASDHLVWSAIVQGEGSAGIGYSQYQWIDEETSQETILEIQNAKEIVLSKILEIERTANPNLNIEDILVADSDVFTHISVKITLFQTVKQVRILPEVRFFEPNYDKLEI